METCPRCGSQLIQWPQLPTFDGQTLDQVVVLVCPHCPPEEQRPDPHQAYDGFTLEKLEAP